MDIDELYMRRCIQLARCGIDGAAPNPMVGAVVVADGRIIGEGYHIRCGGPHAEVNAIRSVRDKDALQHATIYVSLEPCAHYGKTPPCADLIIQNRIPRVVVGCQDPFAKVNGLGISRLREAGIEVKVGVLEQECRELNARFITFHSQQRPWITLKWAQSADGFMDGKRESGMPPTRFSTRFTSTLVHRLRAEHKAILVGSGTALADNPTLTTRLWPGSNPMRLVVDRRGRLSDDLHLLDGSVETHIYQSESLRDILTNLHQRGIQSLLVEGGSQLLQSFLREGLWDEARVETAPFTLHEGIQAPHIDDSLRISERRIDGNQISLYRKHNNP